MKHLILTAICCLACNLVIAQPAKGQVDVTGVFKPNSNETVSIRDPYDRVIFRDSVPADGKMVIPLTVSEGYYYIIFSKELGSLYLKPDFDLTISIEDFNQFDETINFTGKGATENNYLAEKLLKKERFEKEHGSQNFYLSEEKFVLINDSLYQMQKNFLAATKGLDSDFRNMEEQSIKLDKLYALVTYPNMKRFVTNDREFKVSDKYPNVYAQLNKEDEKLLVFPVFTQLILSFVFEQSNPILMQGGSTDMGIVQLSILDTVIKNTTIKEHVAFNLMQMSLQRSKDPDQLYNKYTNQYKDEYNRKIIDEKYAAIKSVSKGMPSPDFNFKDIKGTSYSLSDFKGRYVYIDIWATWCGPCLREIPHLKTLESEMHDTGIAFVSICTQDSYENWSKMLHEKELTGTQLFASESNHAFFVKYSLQGIPRFILLDKEGKIIDSNALRPSDPQLKEQLTKLK